MPGSTKAPYASKEFQGRSANGPWGDSVEEIDWSTGQIMAALEQNDLDDSTIVVWTSDNGAPRRNPPQGSNAPLGGWGYSIMEGGMRVPCIVRWPGRIPPSSISDEITTMMDWLPTFAELIGTSVDSDIDGYDILPLLTNPERTRTPYEAFFYYYRDQLQAVRSDRWKLHLGGSGNQVSLRGNRKSVEPKLYDLDSDIAESVNVIEDYPDIAARLRKHADHIRADLGTGSVAGPGVRPAGRVSDPQPQVTKAESP